MPYTEIEGDNDETPASVSAPTEGEDDDEVVTWAEAKQIDFDDFFRMKLTDFHHPK